MCLKPTHRAGSQGYKVMPLLNPQSKTEAAIPWEIGRRGGDHYGSA